MKQLFVVTLLLLGAGLPMVPTPTNAEPLTSFHLAQNRGGELPVPPGDPRYLNYYYDRLEREREAERQEQRRKNQQINALVGVGTLLGIAAIGGLIARMFR